MKNLDKYFDKYVQLGWQAMKQFWWYLLYIPIIILGLIAVIIVLPVFLLGLILDKVFKYDLKDTDDYD